MNALEIVAASLALSVAASGLLALGCTLLSRLRHLRAGVRQWIWFAALVATAMLPIAGGLSAFARSHAAPQTAASKQPAEVILMKTNKAATLPPHTAKAALAVVEPAATAPSVPKNAALDALKPALPYLLGVVAAGALLGIAGVLVSLARLRAIKRRSTPLDETLSHDLPWLSETIEGRETYLRLSYEIETPIAIGFGRPVILIPTDLANENGLTAIESLVIHEHAHLRHFDDYTNLVQRIIERLNWFNPFVWYMGRQLTLAREMSADDAVLERGNSSAEYAQTLWRMAREMRMPTQPIVAPGAFFTRKQISARIEAILSANRGQLSPLDPTAIVLGLTLAFIAYGLVAIFTPSYEFRTAQADASESNSPSYSYSYTVPEAPAPPDPPSAPPAPQAPNAERIAAAPGSIPTIPPSALGYTDPNFVAKIKEKLLNLREKIRSNATSNAQPQTVVVRSDSKLAGHCTSGCDLSGTDFSGRNLSNVNFSGSDLSNVNFRGANLRGAGFDGATLDGAQFAGADLTGARFSGSSIDGTHFAGAKMDGVSFSGIDLSSAHFDNGALRNILQHGCSGCDLSGLNMRGVDLSGVNLNGVDLSNTNLNGANLSRANFSGVDLSNADLDNADLTEATFSGCDLSGTSTKNAKMDRITMHGSSFN